MKLYILKADSSKEMDDIATELSLKKFKLIDEDDRFKLMRKRRYGNILIQIVSLLLALQVIISTNHATKTDEHPPHPRPETRVNQGEVVEIRSERKEITKNNKNKRIYSM